MASTESLVAILDGIGLDTLGSDSNAARLAVVEAARRTLSRLETPFERMWRLTVTDPCVDVACKILYDLGLWENWRKAEVDEVSLQQLVDFCNAPCDLVLLRRLMRLLTAERYVEEIGEDCYKSTPISLALGDTPGPASRTWCLGWAYRNPPIRNLPRFLAKTGYREPDDPTQTNHMDADPEGLGFFARCTKSPQIQAAFIGAMTGLASSKPDWTDVYDTDLLLDGYKRDEDSVLLVDVGGAHGVDLMRMLAKHPDLPPGSLVLQDLADVLELRKPPAEIKSMVHDFFKPQPIIGARAYLMHCCLHDWDDVDCRRILKQLVGAMKTGYAKLLLYESVMPSVGASTYQAMSDITMMVELSAAERNEARWRTLLSGAGLKIIKIWSQPFSVESVIEAELC